MGQPHQCAVSFQRERERERERDGRESESERVRESQESERCERARSSGGFSEDPDLGRRARCHGCHARSLLTSSLHVAQGGHLLGPLVCAAGTVRGSAKYEQAVIETTTPHRMRRAS